jgi:hypothetical protein
MPFLKVRSGTGCQRLVNREPDLGSVTAGCTTAEALRQNGNFGNENVTSKCNLGTSFDENLFGRRCLGGQSPATLKVLNNAIYTKSII